MTRSSRDTWLVFAIALAFYAILGQRRFHGDGPALLLCTTVPGVVWENHLLFLAVVRFASGLLAVLPLGAFVRFEVVCALSSAVGVACVHRVGSLLGLDRARCVIAAALCALCPAIVMYATVIEIHGVFFGFAGIALWAAASLAVRGGVARGALVGACTAVATGVHASGHFLTVLVAALVWQVRGRHALRSVVSDLASVAVAHALACLAIAWASDPGAPVSRMFSHQFVRTVDWLAFPWRQLPTSIEREWLIAFLPLSVLVFVALFVRALRREALLTVAAWAVYQGVTTEILKHLYEHGAYMLPLACPAAVLVARMLSVRAAGLVIVVMLWLGPWLASRTEPDPTDGIAHAQAGRILAGHRLALLVVSSREAVPFVDCDPTFPWTQAIELLMNDPTGVELGRRFDAVYAMCREQDRELWITEACLAYLDGAASPIVQTFLREHLRRRYVLEEWVEEGLRARRVRRIP